MGEMRGKKAKALRRMAREKGEREKTEYMKNSKTGDVITRPGCVRSVMQKMKKVIRGIK